MSINDPSMGAYMSSLTTQGVTPEGRAALANRLETDRRGANMIPAPNPHPFPGWSKAYPGFPAGDIYRATRRLWQINVIDAPYQIQVDMVANMLAALDTNHEGTDPS